MMGWNFLKRDLIVREPLLVGMLVLVTIAFSALTHAYSRAYDQHRAALGVDWFERGKAELANHRPGAAVEDFRTALVYAPRNWDFGMHLADALTRAGHSEQAFNYYLALWQNSPSSGAVNLQLARLSAQKGNSAAAESYFNGAIFGEWPEDAPANRRTALLERVSFYLDRGDTDHALSQLMILSDNLPEDPRLHLRVAELYSRVGDDRRALNEYRRATELNPEDARAFGGAGEASFELGEYQTAEEYLDRSLELEPSNPSAKRLLALTRSVVSLNPYQQGITEAERIRRALRVFDIAGNRLASCAAAADAADRPLLEALRQRWEQRKATASQRFLAEHPEEIDTLLNFAADAEKTAASGCQEPGPDDSALLAIAHQREGPRR